MIGVLLELTVMIFAHIFAVTQEVTHTCLMALLHLLWRKCTIWFCIAINTSFSTEHFLITIKLLKIFKDRLIRKGQFLFFMYTKNLRLRGNLQRREKKWKVGIFLKWRLLSDLLAREKL